MEITTYGLDLAKSVMQLHWVDMESGIGQQDGPNHLGTASEKYRVCGKPHNECGFHIVTVTELLKFNKRSCAG